jgi:Ca2+-transporting ATPase
MQQFLDPLVIILVAAGVVTCLLRDWVDAAVIFGVVMLNAVVGYIQEAKAVAAIDALSKAMTTEATLIRAGEQLRLPASEIVPGDLVQLQAGDKVPADLRLLRSRELRVDESALTGESLPVDKSAEGMCRDCPLAERGNMAYASALVTYGTGAGLVVATGDATEVGKISQLIQEARDLKTPLTRKIDQFSKVLLFVIVAMALVTFAVGLVRGESAVDMFKASIALAVAAIPEGLPAAVTITLAIGVSRMARRRAVIRKLPAVETLGSTMVICTDKTGTLTENQMTVQRVEAGGQSVAVSGGGYAPAGEVSPPPSPAALETLRAGLLCNDTALVETDGRWDLAGDPTEAALLTSAGKAGLDHDAEEAALPRLDAIPFESQHQYMATLHDAGDGRRLAYMKGAVEKVLARCTAALDANGAPVALDAAAAHAQVDELAGAGLRVLAFARADVPAGQDHLHHKDVAGGLTFLGLQAMMDPPRAEAIDAIKACQTAGVTVKMITGDHAVTATAIARQIGIAGAGAEGEAVTGTEMAALHDREFIALAQRVNVFARVTPEQKLRLVEALQTRGLVVAMTGDGVNDAPALKQADIGIAMGISGTDVAKDAADMVLIDDNFASIEAAVEEGRGVFDNLVKFIAYALPTNVGQGLVLIAAILLGITLPILPLQILWINMITAVLLGLGLAFELKEPGIMQRQPRAPRSPIISTAVLVRIGVAGVILLIGAFALFEWSQAIGGSVEEARTVAVNVFMSVQIFYLFACRSLRRSLFTYNPFGNRMIVLGVAVVVCLQLAFTYAPFMNVAFGTQPLAAMEWVMIVLVGIAAMVLMDALGWLLRRLHID